jgi:2-methylcitrate dehydratase PrpD
MMAAEVVSKETQKVAEFLRDAKHTPLPDEVVRKTAYHVLDTLAAILTGARMEPGIRGITYVKSQGGVDEALVMGTNIRTNATLAALANGISAHADETDDSHAPTLSHPGCAVVPAAFAVAERHGRSGMELFRGVSAGYDIGTRMNLAIGMETFSASDSSRASHAMMSVWGAAAAAIALEDFTEEQVRWALSYNAQQASGVTTWLRDGRHVEKAFDFAGMGARNGVASATMVASGMDGVIDVFSGHPNFFDAVSNHHDISQMCAELHERYEIMRTNIKKFAVGSPAQAAVQAAEDLVSMDGLTAGDVESMEILLPAHLAMIVNNRHMPDINCQYLVAGTIIDGRFSFDMAHDDPRMKAPDIVDLMGRMTLTPDESTRGTRSGRIIVKRKDGSTVERFVEAVQGTYENPMPEEQILAKFVDLLAPTIGANETDELIGLLLDPAQISDVRDLRPLLSR